LSALVIPAIAVLALAALPSARKDALGVYGLVDSVIFEPRAENPDRVIVWGVFAIADNIGIENGEISYIDVGAFRPAQRGYLYYTINRTNEALTRAEWAALQSFAGKREPVAFGGAFPPMDSIRTPAAFDMAFARRAMAYNGRLRRADESLAGPDTFPLRMKNVPVVMRADPARAARHNLFSVR
jgi:hypothetical protein